MPTICRATGIRWWRCSSRSSRARSTSTCIRPRPRCASATQGWCAPRSCARCRRRSRATRSAPRPPAATRPSRRSGRILAPGAVAGTGAPRRRFPTQGATALGRFRRSRAGRLRRRRARGRRTVVAEAAPDLVDRPLGAARAQLHETYIVAQTRDGIVIVDQHAAHERIVYERMKAALERDGVARQILLIPEIVELDEADVERLDRARGRARELRPRARAVRPRRGRGIAKRRRCSARPTRRRWCAILPSTWPNGTRRCRSSAG